MSNQMHPTLEQFYLSILGYSGLELRDSVIVNKSDKIGDMKIDGKFLTLPYHDNLKKPDGRHIFHPLNESYTTPETSFLAMYKKRLVLELNMKLSALIVSLLTVSSDIQLQQKTKNPKLVALLSAMGETDPTTIENFVSMVRHAQKVNDEAFLFDIFVKKNGQVGDVPYSAIGKVNFLLYTELHRALEDKAEGYKVFGGKMRKKDIHSIINVLDVLFNLPDATEDSYTVGTDHKPFRYFNAIMLASYQVAVRVNEVAKMLGTLKEPLLGADDMMSDLEWSTVIEDVYNLTAEIRLIPNQSNSSVESGRLKVKEPKQAEQQTALTSVPVPDMTRQPPQPVFVPQPPVSRQPPPSPQQAQPPLQQSAPTAEEIIRGVVSQQQQMMRQPMMMQPQYPQMMPQQYQQPMTPPQQYMSPEQAMMMQQRQQYPQMMPQQYQQPMMPPQQYMAPQQTMMMPPQQQYQQPMPQTPFNQGQPQPPQQGIGFNPFLI